MNVADVVSELNAMGCITRPLDRSAELRTLEQAVGATLPSPYRELLASYSFDPLTSESVELFGSGCDDASCDVTQAATADRHLFTWLSEHAVLQIGRPATGAYDPVCIDLKSGAIIQFDHEDILQGRRKVRRTGIAASFGELLAQMR
jgi:hypothetical protein